MTSPLPTRSCTSTSCIGDMKLFLFITSCHFIDLFQRTPLNMYTQTLPTRGCSHVTLFPSPVVPLHRSGRVNVWIAPCCPSRGAIDTAKSTTQSWPIAVFLLSCPPHPLHLAPGCRFQPRSYLSLFTPAIVSYLSFLFSRQYTMLVVEHPWGVEEKDEDRMLLRLSFSSFPGSQTVCSLCE